jgi:hypothetical protein
MSAWRREEKSSKMAAMVRGLVNLGLEEEAGARDVSVGPDDGGFGAGRISEWSFSESTVTLGLELEETGAVGASMSISMGRGCFAARWTGDEVGEGSSSSSSSTMRRRLGGVGLEEEEEA